MYDDFREASEEKLWDTEQDIKNYFKYNHNSTNISKIINNELSYGKATAFFKIYNDINDSFFEVASEYLNKKGLLNPLMKNYLKVSVKLDI